MRSLRNPFVQIVIWTLGIGSVLAVIVLTVPWLPEQSSTAARPVDTLYDVLAVISSYVFALVVSILLGQRDPLPPPPRRPAATASRSTATPGWRRSGPRSPPC